VSEEKDGGPDDGTRADDELTAEQIDAETPGVEDAAELEAAEADLAEEAESDEDKVVATPTRRRQRSTSNRPATRSTGATRAGEGTRSRADAERARAAELREKRSIGRFLREVVAELRKVHWPTRRQIVVYTAVVLVFVSFMVALVAGLDAVFAKAVFALFG
jgi:preprotein translocase subunit SecE